MESSESTIARRAHSNIRGTEACYLARVTRSAGCPTRFRFRDGFDPDIPLPTVAGVRLNYPGHFIPIIERNGDRFRVGDPLRGNEWMTIAELHDAYAFTGFFMTIGKPD